MHGCAGDRLRAAALTGAAVRLAAGPRSADRHRRRGRRRGRGRWRRGGRGGGRGRGDRGRRCLLRPPGPVRDVGPAGERGRAPRALPPGAGAGRRAASRCRAFTSPLPSSRTRSPSAAIPGGAAICCARGILASLDQAELRGVLGHELAHISGRDILPATFSAALAAVIASPAALARFRPARAGTAAPAARKRAQVPRPRSRSAGPRPDGRGGDAAARPRRGAGDPAVGDQETRVPGRRGRRPAAGDPVALASALRKIEAGTAELALAPDARVTSVGHLMMASPSAAPKASPTCRDPPARPASASAAGGPGRLPPVTSPEDAPLKHR